MNATGLKNYTNELMLASVGLSVAAVAISIHALICSGDMIVLRCVNMHNKTGLSIINTHNFCYNRDLFPTLDSNFYWFPCSSNIKNSKHKTGIYVRSVLCKGAFK